MREVADDPGSPNKLVIAGGAAATILVFVAGLFVKGQSDLSSMDQREKDHSITDEREIDSLRSALSQGHSERMVNEGELGKRIDSVTLFISQRIDQMNERIIELQRQVSAMEGKLDIPHPPEQIPRR